MPFEPGDLARRHQLQEPFVDVPEHLEGPLLGWIMHRLTNDESRCIKVGVLLQKDLRGQARSRSEAIYYVGLQQPQRMLEMVEVILLELDWPDEGAIELQTLLRLANSAYRVRDDQRALEWRVTPEAQAAARTAVASAAPMAARQLTSAWNAAFGLRPDPVSAYSDAVRTVESAAGPVVTPKDQAPSLGKIIAAIEAKPAKWSGPLKFRAPGASEVGFVVPMLTALRDGEIQRHGGDADPRGAQTVESARAAVFLTVTLVQLFSADGGVTLLP